jgi:GntR family transcriptional regulator/MocR family aminotransferase
MYDMTIQLNADSDKCLYEQIYEHIRQEIREGKLLSGERLPSTRSLAEYLQVARSTVDYAYDQLLSEGYIEARPYRGYFVCPLDAILWMDNKNTFLTAQSETHETSEAATPAYKYDFSPNGTDMSVFPFGSWKRITRNILDESNSELFAQGEPQGDYRLRQTIGRYLHSSRGVECSPEQIIVGAGNDYLLMLLEKILGRHISIAMENPTYKRAYRIFRSFAYNIDTVDVDENGMKIQDLSKTDASCAYVMPSHQFPTGAVMPIGRRTEILRWANEKEDRYIIEDDYDSEFRYRGKPIPSLQSSDKTGKVIYIGTFSKAIAPAIRVSYMVLPQKLLERYRSECYFYSCTVSRIDQRILEEFIRDGYFERHLNKMRKLYREKHDIMLECLSPLKKYFDISGEDAGLHLLITAKEQAFGNRFDEKKLIEKAVSEGVRVYGLSDSLVDTKKHRATLLLGFGGLDKDSIVNGTKLLQKAWIK